MQTKFLWAAVVVLGLLYAFIVVSAQNPAKRRAPRMTSDDVTVIPSAPALREKGTPPSASPSPSGGTLAWERDLSSALTRAKVENRLVIVDVYTDWCGWCKRMDKTTYADARVAALSREEVFVKLDAEDGGEGQQFARRMQVRGYPTTIILDGEGRALVKTAGYLSAADFLAFMEKARDARQ
ncbi:MAG TPA: thioredoxin fold domain-containing protein [Blastocatellia bacterium]|nr:thioredoxin fold domain-containing protein [Blastocatellia bacterium]